MPRMPESPDAITLLRSDHKEIEALFKQCEKHLRGEQPSTEMLALTRKAIRALAVHGALEQQLFYPAMQQALGERGASIVQSLEEHRVMHGLMTDLAAMSSVDEVFNARLLVLMELVRHHVREEEAIFFPACRAACGRRILREIGGTLFDLRKRLRAQPEVFPPGAAQPEPSPSSTVRPRG